MYIQGFLPIAALETLVSPSQRVVDMYVPSGHTLIQWLPYFDLNVKPEIQILNGLY